MGRGGGLVFSDAFFSYNPSLNPANVSQFSCKMLLKSMQIK